MPIYAIAAAVFTVVGVVNIAISIYQMLQKPPEPPIPDPDKISQLPVAEQGGAIPVLFGTRWITRPAVTWWGKPNTVKNQVNPSELQ
ncbi:hypothetical protein [Methylomonas rhizoryzae]|uniref:hypothetical protein n=1 Tax=Methylomonas rhizoryzae TaxID=2608981 RepID=UPI001231C5F7|nr:hypothetical protein [Methylomonas rhizoryzae]